MNNSNIIDKLSLEEKVSLLSGKDFWQTQDIPKHGIPSMFLADGPHGVRKQAAAADHLGLNESIKATCYPTSVTLANTWNKKLVSKVGVHLGKEARDQRVNILLGPGTNIKRNPLCGRNFEYYSEDPFLSGKMSVSHIQGIEDSGISACIKHFAANNQEERRLVIDTIVDERTLREIYLMPFEMAVKEAKVSSLMTSYNMINGVYTNENSFLLNKILREEWKYNGIIVTDWGGNNDRVSALNCTNELEMPGNKGETNLEVYNAVKENRVSLETIDNAVDRLLDLTFKTDKIIKENQEEIDYEYHHEIAYQAAKEAVILLENKNSILPISKDLKVALIGDFAEVPRYQGAGSSIVNPTKVDSTLDYINQYSDNFIGFEKGFDRYGKKNNRLVKKAVRLANESDVVLLYLGLDEISEVEGMDRKHMSLPLNQLNLLDELYKTDKKIIVVLSSGSALELNFTDKIDGLIHGYLLGQAGSRALLDVIFGFENPSGKLSETIPLKYQDVSTSSYFPGKEKTVEYRESLFVGYRYFDKQNIEVKYPFGYGQSYTEFEYSNLNVTSKGVTFKIKNIGSYDGAEVSQLYIGLAKSNIFRADKELKGFEKTFLKINETKEIFIPFDEYSFRYFNVETNDYEIEGGDYDIYINSSLNMNNLHAKFKVESTTNNLPYQSISMNKYMNGDIKNINHDEYTTLLGFEPPNPRREYIKKNRINVHYNTTVSELRYARGWTGRLFSRIIRISPKILRTFGKKQLANTIYMGMYDQPMRGISRMSNGMVSMGELDGLILMFNGKFFKGIRKYFKEKKLKKKRNKKIRKDVNNGR